MSETKIIIAQGKKVKLAYAYTKEKRILRKIDFIKSKI